MFTAKRHLSDPRLWTRASCIALSETIPMSPITTLDYDIKAQSLMVPPPRFSCERWLRCPFSPEARGHVALQMALQIKCFQTQTPDGGEGENF